MGDGDVRLQAERADRRSGRAFELIVSKFHLPPTRSGTVFRSSLVERMAGPDSCPIVSVVAPAGYGKTTLLSQWAERAEQPFAWVSVDEADNDPKVLLTYVAEALDAVQPIAGTVFEALASPVSSVPGSVVPRLGSALSSMASPVVLVLDDVHLLQDRECRAAVSVLADHVPAGSRLVLAGRTEPPVQIARLRASGRLVEIGPGDLSLTLEEAAAMLRDAELGLNDHDVRLLHQRTEGWPVGLYLAALYLTEGGSLSNAAASFAGDDRLVSSYVESELLARISRRHREFLTRTAILERISGPLCDAVLGATGSGATLAELTSSNLLLVPLDRRGQWYRYHHLFRDMLLTRLQGAEPDQIPVLQRRAADWYSRNELPEAALGYSMAAGDVDTAARLVEELWVPTDRQGRTSTLQTWFRWLGDRGAIERHPLLAVWAALLYASTGRPLEAERYAEVVDRWQFQGAGGDDPMTLAWAAALRATLCQRGAEQMRADADEAVEICAAANIRAPFTALVQGVARMLCGDLDGADAALEDAVTGAGAVGAVEVAADALCERSLVAIARNQWDRAAVLSGRADLVLRQAGIEVVTTTALICATQARVALHRGDIPAVRLKLVDAQRFRHLLTYALPHAAVQTRIELASVSLALGDLAGARTLMQEVDDVLRKRPGLGYLVREADALRTRLSNERRASVPRSSALTAAELRLLPLLSTHLSVPDIAAELFLSPHTIKSQMKSIYRKLGASTRNQAVTHSRALGLLEGLPS